MVDEKDAEIAALKAKIARYERIVKTREAFKAAYETLNGYSLLGYDNEALDQIIHSTIDRLGKGSANGQ